jgi:ADP-ribosylglycohydrolase
MLSTSELTDRVLGCVLGGAVGDALGAPFEGLWAASIPNSADLLAGYAEYEGFPRGQYTDDTQLTVATLKSIIRERCIDAADIARSIARLWRSQAVVGPGGACTAAADKLLAGVPWSEAGADIGQAGNGTAMRTSALGLFFLPRPDELATQVAHVSRITHQDPRSVAGGVAIAAATFHLAIEPEMNANTLCNSVATYISPIHPEFASLVTELPAYLAKDQHTTLEYIAWSGGREREFEDVIITPYVIPTVLAALWAVTSYQTSWGDAVSQVIGLGGDVDTLGAIVGGLMGARLGLRAIPEHLVQNVLDSQQLHALAIRYAQLIDSLQTVGVSHSGSAQSD